MERRIKSKQAVVRHMEKHARGKDTAAFLRAEYGDGLLAFFVTADGAAAVIANLLFSGAGIFVLTRMFNSEKIMFSK